MILPQSILQTPAFQYAQDVRDGRIVCGKRIKQAVARFWRWVDTCAGYMDRDAKGNLVFHKNENHDGKGFYIDHEAGMHYLWFVPKYCNHIEGKLAGQPICLLPFQAFTDYNFFAWKRIYGDVPDRKTDVRRIRKIYDRRAKKNAKSTGVVPMIAYMASYDEEPAAQIYIGATKEEQARIVWRIMEQMINSPWANPRLRKLGFETRQREILFPRNRSVVRPLGGDSKTQDGINAQVGVIDEYHAHVDDGVKENLESSMVMRRQPLLYQITTAGSNIQSACKRYEDSIIEVLEERAEVDHLWIMIHEMDEGDDWENPENWVKANPVLGQGMDISYLMERYEEVKLSPSKINEFKTKNLNMWVDAPEIWIESEIWNENKHGLSEEEVLQKFLRYGGHMGVDLSTTTDISAVVLLSEPDENGERYIVPYLFCPKDNIDKRSKNDRVPYRFWADKGHIIATPGDQIDYAIIEDKIIELYVKYNIKSLGADKAFFVQMGQNLMNMGFNVSYVSQFIWELTAGTREFERLVRKKCLRHANNPVMGWMLSCCQTIPDANGNFKVHKGRSNTNGRRIDGIPATINALTNSMSIVVEANDSIYNNLSDSDEGFIC